MAHFRSARFHIGQIVRHYDGAFQGAVLDVDAVYDGSVQGEALTAPDQPFYRVYAMGDDGGFIAYAAEDALRDYQGQLERVFNEVKELEKFSVEPSPSVTVKVTSPVMGCPSEDTTRKVRL